MPNIRHKSIAWRPLLGMTNSTALIHPQLQSVDLRHQAMQRIQ